MTRQPSEEWKPIPGFPGYSASSLGRVVSHLRWKGDPGPRELAGRITPKGYRRLELRPAAGGTKTCYVHQIIALAFFGPPADEMQVRHLDGNSLNNCVTNLAYGTRSENIRDAVRHGTHNNAGKTECIHGHQFDEDNTGRRRDRDGRYCKTCNSYSFRAERDRLRESSAA